MRLSFETYKEITRELPKRVWLLYSVLALAVLAPLLRPGYILTLDMVFTPRLSMPTMSSNDYLLRVCMYALHFLLASDLIEKIILFAVVVLSGVGMHRLVQHIHGKDQSTVGTYTAGIFYVINPFTYDRFMAGQYEVLLGYALLPWFMRSLLDFLAFPARSQMLRLVGYSVLVSIVSIHDIGLMAILVVVASAAAFWRRRADMQWRARAWKFGLGAVALFILTSGYWLVPLMLGKSSVAAQVSAIGAADQSAFATVGGSVLGRIGNIVRLQGFWVEARGLYDLPQAHVPAWGLLGLMVWVLVITGAVNLWRAQQRSIVLVFATSAGIAGLLATGVLSGWPADHIPLLAGYREPEKFVALIALAYAVCMARGVMVLIRYCRTHGTKVFASAVAAAVLLLPLAWTPTMLYGFAGQLRPVQYPADWALVNARLRSDSGNFKTLFLPWYLYMRFRFEGRIIANPAALFFDKPVLISDNPEFKGAALANSTPAKRALDRLLPEGESARDFGARLAALHIKYVIVDRDDDAQTDITLARRSDMQLVVKGATLDVYRTRAYQGE